MAGRKYLVIGGIQRSDKLTREYHRYKKGVIYRVDDETKSAELVFEHVSAPENCAWEDDPSILFKSAHMERGLLYLCTQTEVLVVDAKTFELRHHISHKWMNDVHHVRPSDRDTLIVVSTGLDAVFEYSYDGECLNHWPALQENLWARFDSSRDYRKVVTTKPHASHPNFCFYLEDELWMTRLVQMDAVCVNDFNKRIDLSEIERPHDGVVIAKKIYFTTVDGNVVQIDANSRQVAETYDLNRFTRRMNALGWCRGIHVIDESNVIVGFSRLRKTRWQQNVQWVKYGLSLSQHKPEEPTRIAQYDLKNGLLKWELDLEPWGVGEIFSIFPAVV